jgi:molecular chaperone HscB
MDSLSLCWQCGQHARGLFCPACGVLQQPPAGFYYFFGLEERLSLDLADLQKRFYDLSRKLHPDRYGRKQPREQQYSMEATSILNDAYRTLRDPVQRAEYLLKQRGLEIGEQRSKDVPAELLEEVFELNMALEELRDGDESVRPQLSQAREHFTALLADVDRQLEAAFLRYDEDREESVLTSIRGLLNRRRYIQNLVSEVEKELTGSALSN